MTGMPSSFAFLTAGRIASESMARIMRTLAPFEIRLSTSVNCFVGEACASAEMYFAPDGASAALIAASSVFQRSSWKLDQDTTTMSFAMAAPDTQSVARAAPINRAFLIVVPSPIRVCHRIEQTASPIPCLSEAARRARSQIPVHQVFEILLAAGLGLRIEPRTLDAIGDLGEAAPTRQHLEAIASAPLGVAIGDEGIELAILDHRRRGEEPARQRVDAADMAMKEIDWIERLAAHLGVEVE